MVKKIIISYFDSLAAILQTSKVQEVILVNKAYQVNDIYLGVVQKIFSSINAAFVNLGQYGKSGFIHISDIKTLNKGQNFLSINDLLSINQLVLVQVIKEPTLYKGPRLTSNIHLHGKYVVLMPLCNIILISNRIYDDNERIHLYSLAVLIKPDLMGLIIKSCSQGVSESLILDDLDLLIKQWSFLQKQMLVSSSPSILYKDEDLIKKVVRDYYDKSTKKIVVDCEDALKLAYYYLKKWSYISSTIKTKVQLYDKHACILDRFYIKQTIDQLLRPKVNLLYGGYLFIEHYEALTVIDVNSGSFNKLHNSQETIVKINFYAAIEIAYQLRVRNISGVVIIDFIDMYSQKDQLELLEHFNKLLIYDDCSPQVVELSELGLLELTRRRRSKSLSEIFSFLPVNSVNSSRLFYIDDLYSKMLFNISRENLKNQYSLNKNICSLFFSKQFGLCKILDNKFIISSHALFNKYFIFMDHRSVLRFFYPKANYILPLLFYSRFVKVQSCKNTISILKQSSTLDKK
uniref:Ribonuclease E n=1 Tax=Dipterosiphonia australica TaxID=2007208 RepID=A0A1Z1MLT5_9FLOR|nr:ribonuclease E [Dipterosiphonia australica]ARW66755.1 ribonuclease E [Dipterosiphonia australica]